VLITTTGSTEPFITPWLFDALDGSIVDEWTFSANQDRDVAAAALRSHWDSFITQDDFNQIAAAGLNHVRLPLGYWAFVVAPGEPYIQGQKEYLYRAIAWARNVGLKVMVSKVGRRGHVIDAEQVCGCWMVRSIFTVSEAAEVDGKTRGRRLTK
jgi:glucan 1,3-beta-glucosidase